MDLFVAGFFTGEAMTRTTSGDKGKPFMIFTQSGEKWYMIDDYQIGGSINSECCGSSFSIGATGKTVQYYVNGSSGEFSIGLAKSYIRLSKGYDYKEMTCDSYIEVYVRPVRIAFVAVTIYITKGIATPILVKLAQQLQATPLPS
jgi:hypothetical protein